MREKADHKMTKIEIKQTAQDELLHWMSIAFTAMADQDTSLDVIAEARKQFARVEKLFGYEPGSWAC